MDIEEGEIVDPAFAALAEIIRSKLKNGNEFAFRSVLISGVLVVPVVYSRPKIVNMECQNIMVTRAGKKESLSLCYESYDTIENALYIIQTIKSNYKLNIRTGTLQDPDKYQLDILAESVLPYDPDLICCVCFEPTTDVTECNHEICLTCRDRCIVAGKDRCPICRGSCLNDYKTTTFYYNNFDFPLVNQAYLNSRKYSRLVDSVVWVNEA